MADYIFYVKVANSKFVLDSVSQATIALGHDITYRFDQSDSSNSGHPLAFSTTSDGTHNSGSAYTTGVSTPVGLSPGQSGYYIDIAVTSSTPASLYYYCSNHSGMGSAVITTGNTHVTTNNLGLLLPILANADDQWGSHINQSLRKIEDTFGANADVYTYNITGDTTAITGSATAGGTLAFNDGQHIEVYLNGVKLVGNLSSGNDYTLNASTDTITLASNAVNGDVVNVVVFKTFQFADAVPATGGTFTGTVSHSGTLDVSGGTLTTSTSQKTAIVDGGKGNLAKADVGLGNVTNDAQVPASGGTFSGDVSFGDNNKAQFGAGNDLQIYHDGSHSLIAEAGTGALKIKGDDIRLEDASGNNIIKAVGSGSAELYESGSKKLETTSTGIAVTGEGTFTGNVELQGNVTKVQSNYIDLQDSGTNYAYIGKGNQLTTGASATDLSVRFDGSNFYLSADANPRMKVTSAGDVTINSGNLIIGTAGHGINFHPQGASYVNLLDDYEEGTWTPSLGGNTTYSYQSGSYTKIGNLVFVRGFINVNTLGTGSVYRISGLPFPSENVGGYVATLGVSFYSNSATSVAFVTVAVSGSNADVHYNTGATTALTFNGTFFGNSTRIDFSGCYRV